MKRLLLVLVLALLLRRRRRYQFRATVQPDESITYAGGDYRW